MQLGEKCPKTFELGKPSLLFYQKFQNCWWTKSVPKVLDSLPWKKSIINMIFFRTSLSKVPFFVVSDSDIRTGGNNQKEKEENILSSNLAYWIFFIAVSKKVVTEMSVQRKLIFSKFLVHCSFCAPRQTQMMTLLKE